MGAVSSQEAAGSQLVNQPEFGHRLRQLRLERGIKQTELAGGPVSASYISRLEMGNRLPSPRALSYLAESLGVSVDALVADDRPQESEPRAGDESADAASRHHARHRLLAEATVALSSGDPDRVVELLGPAVEGPDEAYGCDWQLLWTLAEAYRQQHRLEPRVRVLRKMLATGARLQEWTTPQVGVLVELSAGERDLGHLSAALAAGEQALAAAHSASDPARAQALIALVAAEIESGAVARLSGRVPMLLALATEARPRLAAEIYSACAAVRGRQGRIEECDQLTARAMDALGRPDDPLGWARLRLAAGRLRLGTGRTDGVDAWVRESGQVIEAVGGPHDTANLLLVHAWLLAAHGPADEALTACRGAEATGYLSYHGRLRVRLLAGQCLLALGEQDAGRQEIRSAAGQAEDAGYLGLATEAWKTLASALDQV